MTERTIPFDLVNVQTTGILAQRMYEGEERPGWALSSENGNSKLELKSWDDQVVAHLSVAVVNERYVVEVRVSGYYDVDKELAQIDSGKGTLAEQMPLQFLPKLADTAVGDLFPYLRQAVQDVTAQMDPGNPVIVSSHLFNFDNSENEEVIAGHGEQESS